jgi:hypothetical protein
LNLQASSSRALSSSRSVFLFLAASSARQSNFPSDNQVACPHQEKALPSLEPSLEPLRCFGCCRGKSATSHRALYMWKMLACNGMSPCIPRVPFTTLLPQRHSGLGIIVHTLP